MTQIERCPRTKCGEYNPMRCARTAGHDGPCNFVVDGEYSTSSPASPTRSDTREQAAASPSAVGEQVTDADLARQVLDVRDGHFTRFKQPWHVLTAAAKTLSSQAPKPAEQFHKLDPRDEAIAGLYEKFRVARTDGSSEPGGKHEHCDYFVLDLTHDKHAYAAIDAYARSCRDEYPALAHDLWDMAREIAHREEPK